MKPKRIQLKRTKGWRMPANTVKVDRSTRWGNWFTIGSEHESHLGQPFEIQDLKHSLQCFRYWCQKTVGHKAIQEALRGKNLACWCRHGAPCHADVLLEIANRQTKE